MLVRVFSEVCPQYLIKADCQKTQMFGLEYIQRD